MPLISTYINTLVPHQNSHNLKVFTTTSYINIISSSPTMKNIFFSMVFLLSLFFLLANVNEAAVPCNSVEAKAAGCVGFAMGRDSTPSPACCSGLHELAKTVKTVEDKKVICRCLKGAVKAFPGVKDSFLNKIPGACHINVGFPVSLSFNCEAIH